MFMAHDCNDSTVLVDLYLGMECEDLKNENRFCDLHCRRLKLVASDLKSLLMLGILLDLLRLS